MQLSDRIHHAKDGKEISFKPRMGRFKRTFSPEHEDILVEHIQDLANRLIMPVNKKEFLNLAENMTITHQFNTDKKICWKIFLP